MTQTLGRTGKELPGSADNASAWQVRGAQMCFWLCGLVVSAPKSLFRWSERNPDPSILDLGLSAPFTPYACSTEGSLLAAWWSLGLLDHLPLKPTWTCGFTVSSLKIATLGPQL